MVIKNDCSIVARVRQELHASATRENYRISPGDFSRRPTLTLPRVATLVLRGHKLSQQNALNKFFRELKQPEVIVTGSAYCQARQKIKPELFVHLNASVVEEFTSLSQRDQTWRTWRGHRLLGADGTKLNLPDSAELRAAYSLIGNQHGAAGEGVQALAVVLYDLLNDIGLGAHLGPLAHESRVLLNQLSALTQINDLLVLDRNFSDYVLIAWAVHYQRYLLIRCRSNAFSVIEDFLASAENDRVVTLNCSDRKTTRSKIKALGLPEQVTVRLLKFTLPTGETEVLLTTLCDQENYPREEFYQVYGKRWNQESYYDRIKNIFEVERFSGLSKLAIEQDFYGVIFLATLESTLAQSAQAALTAGAQSRPAKAQPQINRAVSYVSLLDHTVALLADPELPLEEVVEQLHRLLQTNPKYNASGRQFDRPPRSPSRSLRNQRYRKRITS
jgi:DDE family transposase